MGSSDFSRLEFSQKDQWKILCQKRMDFEFSFIRVFNQ